MKKKPLHQSPDELKEALELPEESRRGKRNVHSQGNDYFGADYYAEQALRREKRRAHAIPPRSGVVEKPVFTPKVPAVIPIIENIERLWEIVTLQFDVTRFVSHGPDHWKRVEATALKLSCRTEADITVVRLFALFHDCKRITHFADAGHGARAAIYAANLRELEYQISDQQFELLEYACIWHSEGRRHDDPTIGTCWDADRLDVFWRGGYSRPGCSSSCGLWLSL